MKRRLPLLAALLVTALAFCGCNASSNGEGGQALKSEAPTEQAPATPTTAPTITPTESPTAPAEAPVPGADASDLQLVAQGEILYEQQCASCHGADLEGQPNWRRRDEDGFFPAPPHDPSGHTWHHPDGLLFDITKYGTTAVVGGGYKSNMIGFEEQLSDAEIWAVLAFIKSQWPPRIQAAQPGQ